MTKRKFIKKVLKNKKLLLIIIGSVIVLIIVFLLVINTTKKKDDQKKVVITDLANALKDQEVNGIKYSGSKVEFIDGKTNFITTITNNTNEKIEIKMIDIYVYNKKGDLLIIFSGYVGKTLRNKESKTITCLIDLEIKDAYKVEYKIP